MLSIRKGVTADVPLIMSIIREHIVPAMKAAGNTQWGDDYPNDEVFQEDVRLGQLYVVELEGELVGAGALTCEQYPEYAQCGLDVSIPAVCPHRLAAHPKCSGKGIGRILMLKAEEVCREKEIDRIRVDTNEVNTAANKLFVNSGYNFVGTIALDMRPGLQFSCYEKLILRS